MPSANAPAPAAEAAPAAAGDAAESAPPNGDGLSMLAGAAAAPGGETVEQDAVCSSRAPMKALEATQVCLST